MDPYSVSPDVPPTAASTASSCTQLWPAVFANNLYSASSCPNPLWLNLLAPSLALAHGNEYVYFVVGANKGYEMNAMRRRFEASKSPTMKQW